ncbi:hypothetical protein CDAR_494781 [Caerostris darwini]|uniref:Uncharacterized protein n=1 Tax=Caerostris darwini TaxID=1538125 RepID=A0AAV4MJV5_9ARAC|nr:hypothetical protein CDAR_494781 [Caerostris darwini]
MVVTKHGRLKFGLTCEVISNSFLNSFEFSAPEAYGEGKETVGARTDGLSFPPPQLFNPLFFVHLFSHPFCRSLPVPTPVCKTIPRDHRGPIKQLHCE